MKSINVFATLSMLLVLSQPSGAQQPVKQSRPNILFCISDDQSWLHTGAMGDPIVKTPAFDRIAHEGILFTHGFCNAPSCGPSRSAILTGQDIWRLEEAGNIHSTLPKKFQTYTELMKEAGYIVGYTSKGWSPGKIEPGGRTENPAGLEYKGFQEFFDKNVKSTDAPFVFWLGSNYPHRPYKWKSGLESGMNPDKVVVPPYLPDDPIVRNDILDYYFEIELFDQSVAQALKLLEDAGELDNTIIVITSDNGMPFPRAKASLYETGTRMPLAVRWPDGIKSRGRIVDDFVSLKDLAPTFLEAAGMKVPESMTGRGLNKIFISTKEGKIDTVRNKVFTAMERHDGCRQGGKGYPCRAVSTYEFSYIRNYEPTRWPSGDPDAINCARAIPFGEVDSSPTKDLIMDNSTQEKYKPFYQRAFAIRPAEELYDLRSDPFQMNNVASLPQYSKIKKELSTLLQEYTAMTGDPRALGKDAPWDYYPYYGAMINKNWSVDKKPK